jgi:preprotein translocase subunit SecG
MGLMNILLQTIHILGAIFLILIVLLQSGRGGGMGTTFGGAAGQIFGGRGASNFLTRVTTGAAIFFFATSLTLSMLSSQHRSVVQQAEAARPSAAPSVPAPTPADAPQTAPSPEPDTAPATDSP